MVSPTAETLLCNKCQQFQSSYYQEEEEDSNLRHHDFDTLKISASKCALWKLFLRSVLLRDDNAVKYISRNDSPIDVLVRQPDKEVPFKCILFGSPLNEHAIPFEFVSDRGMCFIS
jgi:hypothetical protein